jgi:hypothetical protein
MEVLLIYDAGGTIGVGVFSIDLIFSALSLVRFSISLKVWQPLKLAV